jgi:hypothetical protein
MGDTGHIIIHYLEFYIKAKVSTIPIPDTLFALPKFEMGGNTALEFAPIPAETVPVGCS